MPRKLLLGRTGAKQSKKRPRVDEAVPVKEEDEQSQPRELFDDNQVFDEVKGYLDILVDAVVDAYEHLCIKYQREMVDAACEMLSIDTTGLSLTQKAQKCWTNLKGQ